MEEDNYYLSYYQIMSLMMKIGEMRKKNEYFKDPLAEEFEMYCVKRVSEIAMLPGIVQKISPYNKYIINKSMIDYLSRLTGINVFDKKFIKEQKPVIKAFEERAYEMYMDNLEQNNKTL